ncbi:MAG TPA: sigma-54 dependent transcriptional regulator [Opitutaceae bacterium]|nr:sigma-54 dependent transcriptional regulator [Opitutaceae bacterium]
MARNLLIIGEDSKNRRLLAGMAAGGWRTLTATSGSGVEALLQQHLFHVACVDFRMPVEEALAIVDRLARQTPRLPVIALLPHRDARLVTRLHERGVAGHVVGAFELDAVRALVEQAARREAANPPPVRRPEPAPAPKTLPLVARDNAAKRMLEIALRAASSNVSILILGETGTGKNMLAQTIHEQSALRHKPFVTVSCPSLNRELLESDLFGHVRGAFTGAIQDTWGKVAAADGGTLFLDEIGDLPPSLQPKLLRLLQEKQYERVGETTSRAANVRIIAATNRDLKAEVAAGRFREDLYYRLNVITVEVPPLRNRPMDIVPAADAFLEGICRQLGKRCPTLTPEARRLLEGHSWPGNLRELRNVVERAAVLSDTATLDLNDFPSLLNEPTVPRYQVGAAISLRALETAHIQMVVANSATLEEAARILEIDKSTLYRKRKAMEDRVAKFAPDEEEVAVVGG